MAKKYIHELKNWPNFTWDEEYLASQLEQVHLKQGKLIGKMESLGFALREEAMTADKEPFSLSPQYTDDVLKQYPLSDSLYQGVPHHS